MLKNYYRPEYYCIFFAFQLLVFSFLVFFSAFVVKARSSSSPTVRIVPFFLKLFKALIFLNVSFTKSVKPLFYQRICFEDFIKNTI